MLEQVQGVPQVLIHLARLVSSAWPCHEWALSCWFPEVGIFFLPSIWALSSSWYNFNWIMDIFCIMRLQMLFKPSISSWPSLTPLTEAGAEPCDCQMQALSQDYPLSLCCHPKLGASRYCWVSPGPTPGLHWHCTGIEGPFIPGWWGWKSRISGLGHLWPYTSGGGGVGTSFYPYEGEV